MPLALDVLEIPVAGMTCAHCVKTVRRALEQLPGVRSAAVNLGRGLAEVSINPGRVDRDGLRRAIEAVGYSVPNAGTPAPPPPQTPTLVTIGMLPPTAIPKPQPSGEPAAIEEWNFAVGGMHCASCVRRVESALLSVPGVEEARVNLATERATVVVDTSRSDERTLTAAVAAAGYAAHRDELRPSSGSESLRRERTTQVGVWHNRLVVGAMLTLPLIVLGYLPAHRLGLHTPVGWIMLPFATALQVYLGTPYVRGAWARLRQGSSNMDTLIALGTGATYCFSLYQLLAGDPHQAHYFMDAGIILTLITLGKFLEARSRGTAGAAI
jgi:Cu+-exporting ATPase